MKTNLCHLSTRTMSLIGQFAAKNDVATIQRLSDAAAKIQTLQENLGAIEQDASDIEEYLNGFSTSSIPKPLTASVEKSNAFEPSNPGQVRRNRGKKLRLEVDWVRLGK